MDQIEVLYDLSSRIKFTRGNYKDAESQLYEFALLYMELTASEANILRKRIPHKEKQKWFQIACTLFSKNFHDANYKHKERLFDVLFSTYTMDNLEFSYDSLTYLTSILSNIKSDLALAESRWLQFRNKTNNQRAIKNLENKIFHD